MNPLTDSVTFTVAGSNSASITFAPGSFNKLGSLYGASGKIGLTRVTLLLSPRQNGKWGYAAALTNFVPGTLSVTVSLSIGAQNGSATVTAHLID